MREGRRPSNGARSRLGDRLLHDRGRVLIGSTELPCGAYDPGNATEKREVQAKGWSHPGRSRARPGRGTVRAMSLRRTTFSGLIGLLVLVVVAVAVLAGPGMVVGWVKSLNPFSEETIDRTGPSVLKSLTDLSEYHAASAHYETVVDIENDNIVYGLTTRQLIAQAQT